MAKLIRRSRREESLLSIILAAGPATRMRPLSDVLPKVLLPVHGRPVLAHLIACMSGMPVARHYILTSSRHRGLLESYLHTSGVRGVRVISGRGWETGGDLALAIDHLRPQVDVVVANGDVVTNIDVADAVAFHRERRPMVTVVTVERSDPKEVERLGVLEVGSDGKVHRFTEKPHGPVVAPADINAGLYVFDRRLVDDNRSTYLTPHPFKLEVELFPRLAAAGEMLAFRTRPTYWWDIGTIDAYVKAQRDPEVTRSLLES